MRRLLLPAFALLALGPLSPSAPTQAAPATQTKPAGNATYTYRVPTQLDDGWTTASLAAAKMDPAPLEAMTNTIRRYPVWNVHALLIERDGRLVYEEYFAGPDENWGRDIPRVVFDRTTKHDLRSVSKSVISALIGTLVAGGKIRSVDKPVADFFPERTDLAAADRRRITLRHILTMSAGLEWNEDIPYTDPKNDEIVMTRSADPIGYVLTRPFVSEPGAKWQYNGGTTQVLGVIVERVTGQPLNDYVRAALFQPLGITDFEWQGNLAGTPAAASGLRMRPRDLAKFASLYLHEGRWRDRQVLSPEWVRESTRPHLPLPQPVSAYGSAGYGYQWWHNCFQTAWGDLEARVAVGNGQQRIFVFPQLKLAVTMLAGRYNDPTASGLPQRLLLEFILPSLRLKPGSIAPSAACAPSR
jgi:CubicO group peptidase (beta-lactamase class C family)